MKLDVKTYEERMKKTLTAYEKDLETIRLGRATPVVLNKITVDYYGCPTQISQMAEVKAIDARTLTITPWDSTTLRSIEKAIHESDLGINPQNDGSVIRLTFPPLTEDRRKEIVKDIQKIGENSKVAVRSIRRDCIEKLKAMKKASEITEDDLKDGEKEIQKITDSIIKEIDEISAAKQKEIMEI